MHNLIHAGTISQGNEQSTAYKLLRPSSGFRLLTNLPDPHHSSLINVTRPGLEPGISGSGGRRLIH